MTDVLLINPYLNDFTSKYPLARTISEPVMHELLVQEWKVNVRELINLIERLVVTTQSRMITLEDLPKTYRKAAYQSVIHSIEETLPQVIERVEKNILMNAKKQHRTTVKMAEILGISQPSVVRKLKKYKID